MDGDTLRSRVMQLVQRTRKAVRLYSSAEQLAAGDQGEFTALQLAQWQATNTDLQRLLTAAADHPNQKFLAGELLSIRDRFYHAWRTAETEAHLKQGELIAVAEKGDFVRAALLARALVSLKAREQAAQAAHHELQELVDRSRLDPQADRAAELTENVRPPSRGDELPSLELPKDKPNPTHGKVIHLRTRQGT